jgi:hypothetical protein
MADINRSTNDEREMLAVSHQTHGQRNEFE